MSSISCATGSIRAAVRSGNELGCEAWVNCKRWVRKTVRNPSAAFLELFLALFALLLFSSVFGDLGRVGLDRNGFRGVSYVTFLLPAVLVQVSMGAAITSGLGMVEDLRTGMFEKVVVSPMRWPAVVAGKALADLGRIAVHLLVLLAVGVAMGAHVETGLLGVAGILLVCLLFASWYMALSNALALTLRDEEALDAAGNVLLFPLLFLSSGFLPLGALPATVRTIARVNPVTYAVDAVRALVVGRDVSSTVSVAGVSGVADTVLPALALLMVLNLCFGAVAVRQLAAASSSAAA